MAKMCSIRLLQVLLFRNHISLNRQSRIHRLYFCLYRKHARHNKTLLTILDMSDELIRDIVCKIIHCSLGSSNAKSDRFLYIAFDPFVANNRNRCDKNMIDSSQVSIDFQDKFHAKLWLIYMGKKPLI